MSTDTFPDMPNQPEGGWAFHTPVLDEWSAAFVELAADLADITRDRTANVQTKTGGSYSYSYADLAAIMTDIRPKAAARGLAVSQAVEKDSSGAVLVWTTLIHRSGQRVTWQPLAMPGGSTPQDSGSAITYARRYSVLACLGIATEDDDGAQAGRAVREARGHRETYDAAVDSSPDEVELSTPEQAATFHEIVGQLGEDQKAALKAWFTKNQVNPIEKASRAQADAAIDAARELLPSAPAVLPTETDAGETAA